LADGSEKLGMAMRASAASFRVDTFSPKSVALSDLSTSCFLYEVMRRSLVVGFSIDCFLSVHLASAPEILSGDLLMRANNGIASLPYPCTPPLCHRYHFGFPSFQLIDE
jgi:hypothetical protein